MDGRGFYILITKTIIFTVARGPVPRERRCQEAAFRSFRTLMSIEKRDGPRQGPLGP